MKILLALSLGGLLALAIAALAVAWRDAGADISPFGWAMIAAGGLLSVALGAGLMALSFFSARRGYDDRSSSRDDRDPPKR